MNFVSYGDVKLLAYKRSFCCLLQRLFPLACRNCLDYLIHCARTILILLSPLCGYSITNIVNFISLQVVLLIQETELKYLMSKILFVDHHLTKLQLLILFRTMEILLLIIMYNICLTMWTNSSLWKVYTLILVLKSLIYTSHFPKM